MRCVPLFALAAACGASQPKPTISNQSPARGLDTSIRQIDFLNRTYETSMGDEAPEKITVKDGEYERPQGPDGDPGGFFSVRKPVYGDVDGDGREDAIVITVDNGGGTGMFDAALVYMMRDGQPTQVAVIPGGDRGDGGLRAVEVEPGGVKVERFLSGDGDGACCPSKLTIEHWRWTGKDLAIDDKRTTTEANPDAPQP
jgi:hypothetical protein